MLRLALAALPSGESNRSCPTKSFRVFSRNHYTWNILLFPPRSPKQRFGSKSRRFHRPSPPLNPSPPAASGTISRKWRRPMTRRTTPRRRWWCSRWRRGATTRGRAQASLPLRYRPAAKEVTGNTRPTSGLSLLPVFRACPPLQLTDHQMSASAGFCALWLWHLHFLILWTVEIQVEFFYSLALGTGIRIHSGYFCVLRPGWIALF